MIMHDDSSISSNFRFLHDNGFIKCLIGNGTLLRCIKSAAGSVEHVSFETLQQQTPDWIKQRQFLIACSDVKLKKQIHGYLSQYCINYFTVVGKHNLVGAHTQIGHGTFINCYNDFLSDPIIGDHCVVTTYCQFSHDVVLGNFSHVSAYSYFNKVKLGQGSVIGLRTIMVSQNPITVVDYCNFLIDSLVTKSIDLPGTYYGNRKTSNSTSLDQKIL